MRVREGKEACQKEELQGKKENFAERQKQMKQKGNKMY